MASKYVRLEIARAKGSKFVLRLRAKNGEIVMSGETTKDRATKAAASIIDAAESMEIKLFDMTKERE